MNKEEILQLAIETIAEYGHSKTDDAQFNFRLQGYACAVAMFAQKLGCEYEPLAKEFDNWFH